MDQDNLDDFKNSTQVIENTIDTLIALFEQIKQKHGGNLKVFILRPDIGDVPITNITVEESITPVGIKYVCFSHIERMVKKTK